MLDGSPGGTDAVSCGQASGWVIVAPSGGHESVGAIRAVVNVADANAPSTPVPLTAATSQ
jgi:hypothetical protein